MELQNDRRTPSNSNQLLNVSTVRRESRNTQPGGNDDRKSEVIAFVVNAGMNVTGNVKFSNRALRLIT